MDRAHGWDGAQTAPTVLPNVFLPNLLSQSPKTRNPIGVDCPFPPKRKKKLSRHTHTADDLSEVIINQVLPLCPVPQKVENAIGQLQRLCIARPPLIKLMQGDKAAVALVKSPEQHAVEEPRQARHLQTSIHTSDDE